jgi:hypothetical protein
MPLILDVTPLSAQVAILDATWQDYPEWEGDERWVAFRAKSLIDPDNPPYPGIAVATRSDAGPDGPRQVRVEVWSEGVPRGLRCVHETVLSVGGHGVLVGNDDSGELTELKLAEGDHPLQVWVDADAPAFVSRVVFLLGVGGGVGTSGRLDATAANRPMRKA